MHHAVSLARSWTLHALVTLAALIGGCGPQSVNPLVSDEVSVNDDGLVGGWADEKGELMFSVAPRAPDTRVYRVTVAGKKDDGADANDNDVVVDCTLADVHGHRYADLTMADSNGEAIEKLSGGFVIPVHQFIGIKREGD